MVIYGWTTNEWKALWGAKKWYLLFDEVKDVIAPRMDQLQETQMFKDDAAKEELGYSLHNRSGGKNFTKTLLIIIIEIIVLGPPQRSGLCFC